jgi:antitoxin ParD1/3/4
MEMTSLNISLPKVMKDYVESRVQEGGFSTPSEYMRALVREDQKRKAEEKLEALLLEGIQSGPATPMTPQNWKEIRAEVLRRVQQGESGSLPGDEG